MTHESTAIETIERIVVDTFASASGGADGVTRDTEVLQLVDSLGMIIALADVQAALDVELDPLEIIDVFQCRSLGDVAAALRNALSARLMPQA